MSPHTVLAFTALLFLAILGGVAGILLERQRAPAQPAWRNPAIRDALLPIAGWTSLFGLDVAVALRPGRQPTGPRAIPLLGRLKFPTLFVSAVLAAVSVLYYDGLTLNLLFMGVIVAVLGIVHRPRGEPAPSAADR